MACQVLQALSKHKPVVAEQWVLDSIADGVAADPSQYLLLSDSETGLHTEITAAHAAAELVVLKPNAKSAAAAKQVRASAVCPANLGLQVMLAEKWPTTLDPSG